MSSIPSYNRREQDLLIPSSNPRIIIVNNSPLNKLLVIFALIQSNEALMLEFIIYFAASAAACELDALPPTDQSPQLAPPPTRKELLKDEVCSAD